MRKDEKILSIQTSDLPLATTLVTLGFNFSHLERLDPTRVIFAFPQTDDIQKVVDKFWRGELSVEPKAFSGVQRQLKAQIRNVMSQKELSYG